jgi:BlaI family transcriptional regulator, penicillinase repressor
LSKRNMRKQTLPPMELAIMQILWDHGPSTVQEVQSRLSGASAYTTVQTTLNTMEKKGRTKRTLKGRAFIYRAAVSKDIAAGSAIRDLINRMFGGSTEDLLMSLAKTEKIDVETVDRLKRAIVEAQEME